MARKRGRPLGSKIKTNLHKILTVIGESYGYELWRIYQYVYNKEVELRLIYYNLSSGEKQNFWTTKLKEVNNANSWDGFTERRYYTLNVNNTPEEDEYARIFKVAGRIRTILQRDTHTMTQGGKYMTFKQMWDLADSSIGNDRVGVENE